MFYILQNKHIQEVWKGSYIDVNSIESSVENSFPSLLSYSFNIITILGLSVLFIIYYNRIIDGFYYVFNALSTTKRLIAIEHQLNIQICRNTLFTILFLTTCFVTANYLNTTPFIGENFSSFSKFIIILGGCCIFFILRKGIFTILYLIYDNPVFKLINKIFYTYAILECFLLLIGFAIQNFLKNNNFYFMLKYGLICSVIVLLLYLIKTYKLIISNRFSHVFYILYLCILEVLPLAVLWQIIFN